MYRATGDIAVRIRAYQPPVNDDFANATVLSGRLPIRVAATNVDASPEPGEPLFPGVGNWAPVWFRWTATTSGVMTVETEGKDTPPGVEVFGGTSFATLGPAQVASWQQMFTATAGTTYYLMADSFNAEDPFTLTLRKAHPPANDAFANALVLKGGLPITVTRNQRRRHA